jgi:hypothetical protein
VGRHIKFWGTYRFPVERYADRLVALMPWAEIRCAATSALCAGVTQPRSGVPAGFEAILYLKYAL